MKTICSILLLTVAFASCKKGDTTTPVVTDTTTHYLVFKFKFDSTQPRLNAFGQPSVMPAGNAGLNPSFNSMSAHYIELAPSATTLFGQGAILYKAEESTAGGASAIDFSKSNKVGNGEVFFKMALKNIPKGDYEWLRISLAYQNYDVKFYLDTTISTIPYHDFVPATIASFIGFNTYITNFKVKNSSLTVNGNRKQGFWGFESTLTIPGIGSYTNVDSGQSAGTTTVVNPISSTSPIPAGSCVVTGQIKPGKLTITGSETKDVVVEVSLSTNKSFEWKDHIANGRFEPLKGEKIVDMGIRGMIPTVQ